jgi:molecular chaperone GrpE
MCQIGHFKKMAKDLIGSHKNSLSMSKKNKTNKTEELKTEQLNAENGHEEVVETAEGNESTVHENTDAEKESLKAECEDKADEITLIKRAYEDLNDKHLRLQAEFDNFRKRTLREKIELTKTAGEGVLKDILPVIDDFDRALQSLNEASDLVAVKDGIEIIHKKFNSFLVQQGVREIDAIGKELDTDLHEAITKIPAPSVEFKGKIIDCILKGYVLNDKVIRFAKVVIGE